MNGDSSAGRRPPTALLLDLDDTILDDSGGTAASWATACVEAASSAPGLDAAALDAAIARVRLWYWADVARHREGRLDLGAARLRIVMQALAELGLDLPDCAAAIVARVNALREQAMQPLPGAIATLTALRRRGVRLALLTNGAGPAQRAKITRFDLAGHFEAILIEGENPWGKPDTRVYQAALRALDVPPHAAWMAGDNLVWDVATPMRLGIHGIWVDAAGAGLPADAPVRPDRIIRALPELLDSV